MNRALDIRDVADQRDLRAVIDLERCVWGYPDGEEAVPLAILAAAARRGAIVLGAFDGDTMVGAAYSFPAVRDDRLTQWSHMLGVLDSARNRGVGRALKLRQRERAVEMGVDLIEWTFDPLQAANAHFNLARLGAVCEEYEVNMYGGSASPLWRGSDSDRLIAQWYIRTTHVERRIARRGPIMRSSETLGAVCVLEARKAAGYVVPGEPDLQQEGARLTVEIPDHLGAIQEGPSDLAARWRRATRSVFTTYLHRGYRAVDFWSDRTRACGSYLLARHDVAVRRRAA